MPEVVSLHLDGPRSIACKRSERADLPADSVRAEAIVTGVSAGTERMWYEGTNPAIASGRRGYPYAPGYEFVGRVTEVGKAVTDVVVGAHVFAMKPHASEAILGPTDYWGLVPESLASEDALAIALTATNLHMLHRVRPEAGDAVAVIGLGTLGLLCCQVLRATGAGTVIAVSRSARKRDLALGLGADVAFDTLDPDLEAKVKECTGGRGADVAVEWAGVTGAVEAAMRTVRNQGDVVVGGFHVTPFAVSGEVLFSKEIRIHGVRGSGNTQATGEFNRWSRRENLAAAAALVASGAVRGEPLVTHRIAAPDLAAAYHATGAPDAHYIQVVLDWTASDVVIVTLTAVAWSMLGVVAFTWLGYPLLLHLFDTLMGRRPNGADRPDDLPTLTLLIAAHDEEAVLDRKLGNSLDLDYPDGRLDVLVASDGSSDRTVEIARGWAGRDERVRVFDGPAAGKTATQNAAVALASGDVVLFTNADTMLASDTLVTMARHFRDPGVGCVGARMVWLDSTGSQTGEGTSFYWRFEQMLWRLESSLGVLAWAPGACMAVRRAIFEPMDPRYGEDVVLPIQVAGRGARVVYEPAAVAFELAHSDAGREFRVRTRMVLRSFAGTLAGLRALPWRSAWAVGVVVLAHKVLRWLTSYFLGVLLVASVALVMMSPTTPARVLLGAQVLGYGVALAGWALDRAGVGSVRPVSWIYYFMLSIVASGWGVARALRGERMTRFGTGVGQGLG